MCGLPGFKKKKKTTFTWITKSYCHFIKGWGVNDIALLSSIHQNITQLFYSINIYQSWCVFCFIFKDWRPQEIYFCYKCIHFYIMMYSYNTINIKYRYAPSPLGLLMTILTQTMRFLIIHNVFISTRFTFSSINDIISIVIITVGTAAKCFITCWKYIG